MPKKKMIGKTKLQPDALTTSKDLLNLVIQREKINPTSVRLKESDKLKLKKIVKDVNEKSASNISKAGIIRALIHIGSKIKKEKIIDAYKELL